ncbi:glycosyltransferase family 2 protein [Arabiibacter massiliensis]|uniref:glycosyltransferase family 2 protein n=1 Tax=Arabiibacter massiliensis TaxID=1870985 RepID=UPI0018D628A7|nr:glycosyltransferase [Arabiibacter massiliensis]
MTAEFVTERAMCTVPIFSIIVPVYNTTDYLPQCVDGVLSQSFDDWELILVDDGSTDGSGAVCEAYAARDKRVRVLHQANGGVSAARNAGLDVAVGEYVWFCDSDDSVVPGALDELYACIADGRPSMVVFPVEQIDSDGNRVGLIPAPEPSFSLDEGPLQCGDLLYPFAHVFKRVLAGGERFDTSLALLEDRDFFYRIAWKAAGRTAVVGHSLYRYLVTREDSAVNSSSVAKSVAATRVQYDIFRHEESLGYPMPAFRIFAGHTVGVLSLIARRGSAPDDFEMVRSRLLEQRSNVSLLDGALKLKCILALEAPSVFKALARLTGYAKRERLGSTVIAAGRK